MTPRMNKRLNALWPHQHGFTLVEIMIAITLSLFLISGMIKVYTLNKKSALVQSELARMQENQRFVVDFLNREIRMAGFYDQSMAKAVYPIDKFIVGSSGTHSGDNDLKESDTITIQYESDKDCLGNAVPASDVDKNNNTIAKNTYSVSNETLYCEGNTGDKQPIADGIENMQVLYSDGTHYLPPENYESTTPSDSDLNKIKSIRIALLFKTDATVKTQTDTRKYYLLDAPEIAYTDKYRREIITTTITLRN